MHCKIVDAEKAIYQGDIKSIAVSSVAGEMAVLDGHAPLLAKLMPAPALVTAADGTQIVFYISGGILEVQPKNVVILADTAEYATNLNQEKIEDAKNLAVVAMQNNNSKLDYSAAAAQLSTAAAQLRALQKFRKSRN